MDALECLYVEHNLIEEYIRHLVVAADEMRAGTRPPSEFFEQAVVVARQFVNSYHHDKEDRQMFALLAEKHSNAFAGILDEVSYQHERGREYVANIQAALAGYRSGGEEQTAAILENLDAFVEMLAEHVRREDEELFPLVRENLTDDESQQLLVEFGCADEKAGVGFFEQSRERVKKMAELVSEENRSPK